MEEGANTCLSLDAQLCALLQWQLSAHVRLLASSMTQAREDSGRYTLHHRAQCAKVDERSATLDQGVILDLKRFTWHRCYCDDD